MFDDFVVAACLVLVLEGMLPFLSPRSWRRAIQGLQVLTDRQIRFAGLASMLAGVVLLYILN
ncbi:MAG: DUF2065 domain-containing protein [Pseudomonadales bacterium]|nr:DUF2065 domain-containing protein [Gammaproteobacteria bacterium]NNL56958.1 DUF2065 domain-containing protein [Pseudomonadales bacterium]